MDAKRMLHVSALIDYFLSECVRLRTGRAQFGPFTHIFIADPRDVQVFVSNAKNQDKTFLYRFTAEAIGEGLVSISGAKWRRHHKIIAPAFFSDVLESFVSVFNRHSDAFVENLRNHADGNPFDVEPELETLAFSIICETAMGIRMGSETDKDRQYYKALEVASARGAPRSRRFPPPPPPPAPPPPARRRRR
ncbi:Cytochrome P450 4C1, partial [Gryllus bimaculatus]